VLIEIIETGDLKGIVDRSYSLKEIVDAHEYVDKGHKAGNVVLKPVA
jgi:NADPH:quinone reductase-like Zn-dependent oxidoreductase